MRILRFTGHINTEYVDVRLTTDMQHDNDENFDIVQIQEGQEFNINDKKDGTYNKYFSVLFKETNNSISTAKQFANDHTLDLRIYDEKNNHSYLVDRIEVSNSSNL